MKLTLLGLLISLLIALPVSLIPCATVQVSLQDTQLALGQTQAITTQVENCGDRKARLGVTLTVTDAVGHVSLIRNTIQNYDSGEALQFTNSYPIAADASPGTYRVMVIVFDDSHGNVTELNRDEKTFEVSP